MTAMKAIANRGFTIFELLLVVLLLGLVYALAGPDLTAGTPGLDAKSATRQLAAGLRKARSIAATERRDALLALDVNARSFTVTGDPRIYKLPKTLNLSLFTAESEILDTQTASIRFFPDGSSTGGRITITTGGHQQGVDVDWLTGRVKIL
jgi:general secretion pathway protein H